MSLLINPYVSFPPAGGGALVEDTFNRANATSLGSTDGGSLGPLTWAVNLGSSTALGISSNRAACLSAADNVQSVDSGAANVSVTCIARWTATPFNIGLVARVVDGNNFILASFNEGNGGQVVVFRKSSGTYTVIGSAAGLGSTANTDRDFELRCSGTTVKAFTDGVERVSITESAHQTATKVGVRLTTTTARVDDFAAEAI